MGFNARAGISPGPYFSMTAPVSDPISGLIRRRPILGLGRRLCRTADFGLPNLVRPTSAVFAVEAHFALASARSLSARSSRASASSNLPSRISGSASCMTRATGEGSRPCSCHCRTPWGKGAQASQVRGPDYLKVEASGRRPGYVAAASIEALYNYRTAPNPATASGVKTECHRRGVGEPDRSAT